MTSGERRSRVAREGPDPLVGQVVNEKFRIIEEVASGGMGKIYRAEQLPLGREVAIKVLHSRFTDGHDDPAFQKRFFLEASILSRLQHPNIVTVFDYGRIEGLPDEAYFMAMEFLAGETLHRRLKREGTLDAEATVAVVRQIAKGLREAHRQGVVHRDLKPSNVMLVPDESGEETVKILDFGLVKVLRDDSEELTKEGSFLGSPRYMSPEQIAHGRVDLRTDIYSLGVILYQCLCGRAPFEADNAVHVLMAHLHSPVPSFAERNAAVDVAEPLGALALRCLDKQPEGRPASMDEFLQCLRQCESALGLQSAGAMLTDRSVPAAPRAILAPVEPPALPPTMAHPRADAPVRRTLPLVIVALATATLVLALGLHLRSRPSTAVVAATPSPAISPPPPTPYRLEIDSVPPGAAVIEGGNVLGATPVGVMIDNATVVAAPRRFVLRLPGHQPFELRATGSTESSVRTVVTLIPEVPVATAEPAPPRPSRVDPRVRRPVRPTPHPTVDSDIRLHR